MKKQYIVLKYVMAENSIDAISKAKKSPVSEVYIHSGWLDKNKDNNFFEVNSSKIGFKNNK